MYICPTCGKEYKDETYMQKHFLTCWKEKHPYHKSTPAPRSENIEIRNVNDGVLNFFNNLKG